MWGGCRYLPCPALLFFLWCLLYNCQFKVFLVKIIMFRLSWFEFRHNSMKRGGGLCQFRGITGDMWHMNVAGKQMLISHINKTIHWSVCCCCCFTVQGWTSTTTIQQHLLRLTWTTSTPPHCKKLLKDNELTLHWNTPTPYPIVNRTFVRVPHQNPRVPKNSRLRVLTGQSCLAAIVGPAQD